MESLASVNPIPYVAFAVALVVIAGLKGYLPFRPSSRAKPQPKQTAAYFAAQAAAAAVREAEAAAVEAAAAEMAAHLAERFSAPFGAEPPAAPAADHSKP